MIRGSASQADWTSAAQPALVVALTASVKYMLFSENRAARKSGRVPPGPGPR